MRRSRPPPPYTHLDVTDASLLPAEVRESQYGLGLFATMAVGSGTDLAFYGGPIKWAHDLTREQRAYTYDVRQGQAMDSHPDTPGAFRVNGVLALGAIANSARGGRTNSKFYLWVSNNKVRVTLRSTKPIQRGEEILTSYGSGYRHYDTPYQWTASKLQELGITVGAGVPEPQLVESPYPRSDMGDVGPPLPEPPEVTRRDVADELQRTRGLTPAQVERMQYITSMPEGTIPDSPGPNDAPPPVAPPAFGDTDWVPGVRQLTQGYLPPLPDSGPVSFSFVRDREYGYFPERQSTPMDDETCLVTRSIHHTGPNRLHYMLWVRIPAGHYPWQGIHASEPIHEWLLQEHWRGDGWRRELYQDRLSYAFVRMYYNLWARYRGQPEVMDYRVSERERIFLRLSLGVYGDQVPPGMDYELALYLYGYLSQTAEQVRLQQDPVPPRYTRPPPRERAVSPPPSSSEESSPPPSPPPLRPPSPGPPSSPDDSEGDDSESEDYHPYKPLYKDTGSVTVVRTGDLECTVQCVQCIATSNSTGQQCKNTTCDRLPLCWVHYKSLLGLVVRDSEIPGAGKGLFTVWDHRQGATVVPAFVDPSGHAYELGLFNQLFPGNQPVDAAMVRQGGQSYVVDPTCIRFIWRYINHSEDPNCQLSNYDGEMSVEVDALRDIQAGEELTIKYSPRNAPLGTHYYKVRQKKKDTNWKANDRDDPYRTEWRPIPPV